MQQDSTSTSLPMGRQAIGLGLAFTALGAALWPVTASPSSHREAPFITEMPKVDATDFYMFRSWETGREDHVVLIANYQPLQDPYGGPNYFTMDPVARYEIKIDNDGDAREDMTFRFLFDNENRDIKIPVGNPGQEKQVRIPLRYVASIPGNDAAINQTETYKIKFTQGDDPTAPSQRITQVGTGVGRLRKPLDNVGEKTIPNYAAYADQHEYDVQLPGGFTARVFVGQRKDPFVVNLGETFDLVNLNPLGAEDGNEDDLADANVTSIIMEIPIAFLVPDPEQPTIGAWTTASQHKSSILVNDPSLKRPAIETGEWVQVSRLSSPLVNEVVIGLEDKNRFNESKPMNDTQFIDYVTHPVLPELLEALFGVTAPNQFPRADLVQAFVTGVPGLNQNGAVGEMLRLNTSIPSKVPSAQSRLGVLGGDTSGFPNGRRPGDDVVDIELRVLMGALLDSTVAPDGQLPYTDGAFLDASFFDPGFPFLLDPLPGSPQ